MTISNVQANPAALSLNPHPKGHFLLGNAAEMQADTLAFFKRIVREYGDIAAFRVAIYNAVLIVHPDQVQQVMVKDAAKYHKSQIAKAAAEKFATGLFSLEGETWQKHRKLIQPAFHYRRIQSYAETMIHYTSQLMDGWGASRTIDLEEEMSRVTLNIVNKTLFDADVNDKASRVHEAMQLYGEILGTEFRAPSMLPGWVPTKRNQERKAVLETLHKIILDIINERRASQEDRGDLLSMLLLSKYDDGTPMPDDELRDEVLTLFLGGHETSSAVLTWALILLAQNPMVEAALVNELQRVLNGRMPTLEDLPKLEYTEMVIKETMRLYPPGWILGRMPTEDTEIGGKRIKKGTVVFISAYLTHRDPRWWEDADSFIPERFSGDYESTLPKYAYFPFGGGPRVCIGVTFAMMETRLALAALVQRYKFELAPDARTDVEPQATLRPKYRVKMRVTERDYPADGDTHRLNSIEQ